MSKATDVGLLVLRVGFGAAAAAHGAQKLFGWFGGHGLEGTGGAFESMGLRPGAPYATAAPAAEAGGGAPPHRRRRRRGRRLLDDPRAAYPGSRHEERRRDGHGHSQGDQRQEPVGIAGG